MCFITPKRVRCGKAPTISVVVRGPCRNRSRMDRLVLSDKAFHTASSSSSGTLAPLACGDGTVLGDSLQHQLPAVGYALPVRRLNEANGAMAEFNMGSAGLLFEFYLDMVQGGVRHEQRSTQF